MKKNIKNILIVLSVLAISIIAFLNISSIKETGSDPVAQTLNFKILDAEGKEFDMSSLQGKVLIVDFWDTWCPPCRKSIPEFIEMRDKYSDKEFEIVGIAFGRDGREKVRKFSVLNKINYRVLVADPYSNPDLFKVYKNIRAIPTAFIIDKQGNIVKRLEGYRPAEEFENLIKGLF
ncbi:MAG: TlpA family protein disulfide reductase, partial [bacterium]|nr:TlpA family protein disulfide reductase [bacterium]